jgi:thiamine pyrophosphate-dependent acetolactate synthase large subunit-like protein
VVAVCGDFAFGLSALEMETAVRHRVPVVVVVANNDGNAGVRRQREMFPGGYPEGVCGFQPGLRYDELMRTFGGHAEHVSRADALEPALRRALASGVASCVNVALDPHASFPRDH